MPVVGLRAVVGAEAVPRVVPFVGVRPDQLLAHRGAAVGSVGWVGLASAASRGLVAGTVSDPVVAGVVVKKSDGGCVGIALDEPDEGSPRLMLLVLAYDDSDDLVYVDSSSSSLAKSFHISRARVRQRRQ